MIECSNRFVAVNIPTGEITHYELDGVENEFSGTNWVICAPETAFICGGNFSLRTSYLTKFWCSSTERKTDMLTEHSFHAIVFDEVLNTVFVFGGVVHGETIVPCEKYSLTNDKWTQLTHLPKDLRFPHATSHGNKVFLMESFSTTLVVFHKLQSSFRMIETRTSIEESGATSLMWEQDRLYVITLDKTVVLNERGE
jgi:hypothetical protein